MKFCVWKSTSRCQLEQSLRELTHIFNIQAQIRDEIFGLRVNAADVEGLFPPELQHGQGDSDGSLGLP